MRYLILAVFGVMAFSACGQSIDTAEWTEEVRLSDGSIVQVSRKESAYPRIPQRQTRRTGVLGP